MSPVKLIVLDDDPTGSQTVHGCLLLMQWDIATLRAALDDEIPLFFILANTRAMDAAHAAAVTREVCRNLKAALAERDQQAIFISRSDSTLRGHYPVETDVIAQELGPFDAHFIVPAFFEAGRITRDSIHYLKHDDAEIPVHETEFARDSVFGYRNSYLPAYVEEKTGGRILAKKVERLLLDQVRSGVYERLLRLADNACVVVDAECQADLDGFAKDVIRATQAGKRFLFRSAASLITSLAQLPPQPLQIQQVQRLGRGGKPGAIIVGSHVARTSAQLAQLLREPGIEAIEIDVTRLPAAHAELLTQALARATQAHGAGRTALVYTSRKERTFDSPAARLAFGEAVSKLLIEVVQGLPQSLGWLMSKGGITSNDVLSRGLKLQTARLLGQILPGVSIVRCPPSLPRFGELPVVIFPGNVGDDRALASAYRLLAPA